MILHLHRQMRCRRQLAERDEQARDLDRRRHAAETACADLHTRLADLHACLADLEQRQASLMASRSWRMTRPLRAIAAWARSVLSGHAGRSGRD